MGLFEGRGRGDGEKKERKARERMIYGPPRCVWAKKNIKKSK